MRIFYDFHIHSSLSPCASEDMTINNIVNMSRLKGLDAISVCDHNCAANLKAADIAARRAGLLFLPGLEINTAEEVHLLSYFEDVKAACAFGEMVYGALPDIKNNEDFFGRQLVMDEDDHIVGKMDKLLISALPLSIDECVRLIGEYGGYPVPAHINRDANSILSNLGFFPQNAPFKALEVMPDRPVGIDLSDYRVLHSSDAHFLEDISEKEHFVITKNKSLHAVLHTFFD